ncbi:hypothetical protein [Actinoplanes subglobosus]|uniref:Uncharacterized protein n=1 Tax=Actinoplanes subglobosus TaxID=1547892 RepID=A0ABV8IN90_9ACTN
MTEPESLPAPRRDPWTVAIHDGPHGRAAADRPLGTGVLIDPWRVLTSYAVVRDRHLAEQPVWVAFPKAPVPRTERRAVATVRTDADGDIAVLVLAGAAPDQVRPAPLLCPDGADLAGEPWWTFGFPPDSPFGADGYGTVGSALAYGRVRLDADRRRPLRPGFTGAGLWSPRFRAVVGLVGQIHTTGGNAGEAAALTLRQAAADLPGEHLTDLAGWSVVDAGETALAAWGWSLTDDVEATRHWRPRARGVAVDAETGYRFRGRRAALRAVTGFLDRGTPDGHVLVVTGSPGVGKSAVLGRIVTTADEGIRRALPADDDSVKARVGSVSCAVHVKGKTAHDVAVEIARAAAVRLPDDVTQLAPALLARLTRHPQGRFNLVLDALDEAVTPGQAQQIVEDIVLPVARTCAAAGAQVVVGTRRSDDGGDLIRLFGPDLDVVDLDDERYFEAEDLTAYALATLRLVGAERDGNPYADIAVAGPLAARIAHLADRNFLVAGLTARRHGLHDSAPADPARLDFPADVDAALEAYVARLPAVGGTPARLALTALAHAWAPGFTVELWQVVLAALGACVGVDDLTEFARSSAANFIVETSGRPPAARFRLFHQALDDALRRARATVGGPASDQRDISEHLIRYGRRRGWAGADPYLLSVLPEHAAAGGVIDELLTDYEYLLHADLLRLVPPAAHAHTVLGQQRARLLRLTPNAVGAGPAERSAEFSVTAAIEGIDARIAVDGREPYRAVWAAVQRRPEWAALRGHTGDAAVVCSLTPRDGRDVVASGGTDGTVRIWNPETGQQRLLLRPGVPVTALAPVRAGTRALLAVAGPVGGVTLWDPETGQERHRLDDLPGMVRQVIAHTPGRVAVVTGDGTVTVWEPVTGETRTAGAFGEITAVTGDGRGTVVVGTADGSVVIVPDSGDLPVAPPGRPPAPPGLPAAPTARSGSAASPDGPVGALCHLVLPGGAVIAAAAGPVLRIWDAATGQPIHVLQHPGRRITALSAVRTAGGDLLATAADDAVVRLWNPATGRQVRTLPGRGTPVTGLCVTTVRDRPLLVSVGDDTVRLWDVDAQERTVTTSSTAASVTALVPTVHQRSALVACGHGDGLVQLRNAANGAAVRVFTGHEGPVTTLTTVHAGGEVLLASGGTDHTVRMWTVGGGQRPRQVYQPGWSWAVCAVFWRRQVYLACAGRGGTVRLWDPWSEREWRPRWGWFIRYWPTPAGPISSLCPLPQFGGALVAGTGVDGTVRIWEVGTGQERAVFTGHTGRVRVACALGNGLIASAGDDRTVRIWDGYSGAAAHVLTGHTAPVTALCLVTVSGRRLLASAGQDATVRLWDPETGTHELTIPVHHPANACTEAAGLLIVGTAAGALGLSLSVPGLPPSDSADPV